MSSVCRSCWRNATKCGTAPAMKAKTSSQEYMSSIMKYLRFWNPTQLFSQGQWWSMFSTHLLHVEQWWQLHEAGLPLGLESVADQTVPPPAFVDLVQVEALVSSRLPRRAAALRGR